LINPEEVILIKLTLNLSNIYVYINYNMYIFRDHPQQLVIPIVENANIIIYRNIGFVYLLQGLCL
jgi:VanZ family protein